MPKLLRKTNYTDDELIQMMHDPDGGRKEALRYIYINWRHDVMGILARAGNQLADSKDAIQEAVMALDNSVRRGRYKKESSLKNYFIGICKMRIFSNQRSTNRISFIANYAESEQVDKQHPEIIMLDKELVNTVNTVLNRMDSKCREMLKRYGLGYKMREIAEEMDLTNTNNAEQQVYQCRQRLKNLLNKNPVLSNYLKSRHES